MARTATIVAAMVIGSAHAAFGQTPSISRAFVSVNGAYQVADNDFADAATRRDNAEDGRLDTTYTVKGGPALDIAAGAAVWRRLGVGVAVSRFSVSTPTALSGSVPHPFFFNRLRPVSADVSGLKREELAVNAQLRGIFPVGTRVQAMVFGGPSFFQVRQGVVTDFTYSESYPFDDLQFRSATTTTESVSKIGFNAGADVSYFFARQLGVGGMVQFSGTTMDLLSAGGDSQEIKVGGLQAGAGLRIRF